MTPASRRENLPPAVRRTTDAIAPWPTYRALPIRAVTGLALLGLAVASCSHNAHHGRTRPIDDRLAGPAGRIAFAYHGALLDEDLDPISFEADEIRQLQGALIDQLSGELAGKKGRKLRALVEQALAAEAWDATEILALQDALLGRLLADASTDMRDRVAWRRRALNDAFFNVEGFDFDPPDPSSRLGAFLDRSSLFRFFLSPPVDLRPDDFTLPTFDTPYMATCRTNGVPIPPDWGNPGWKRQGVLPQEDLLALEGLKATVWAYQDPNGTCLALPRRNASNSIRFLGIICQSDRTGKACFWDNIDAQTNGKITGADPEIRIAAIKDGSNLGETCTDCHRGRNAFLIHPTTALDVTVPFNTDPSKRYQPISGQTGWGNPPPRFARNDGACAQCHEIPALTFDYCTILRNAAERTMPSSAAPAGWNDPNQPYADHIELLKQECP